MWYPALMRKISCVRCSTPFETKRRNGTHCDECIQLRNEGRLPERVCTRCGEEMPRRRGRAPKLCRPCLARPTVTCSLCGVRGPDHGGRRYPYCADCSRTRLTEVRRDGALRARYGLSLARYLEMLDAQGRACGCCGTDVVARWETTRMATTACVDHDHATGRVRGLLCGNCNVGIGLLGDTPERLEWAVAYLKGVDMPTYGTKLPKDI